MGEGQGDDAAGDVEEEEERFGSFAAFNEEGEFDNDDEAPVDGLRYYAIFTLTGILQGLTLLIYLILGSIFFKKYEEAELKTSLDNLKVAQHKLFWYLTGEKKNYPDNMGAEQKKRFKNIISDNLADLEMKWEKFHRKRQGKEDENVWTYYGSFIFCSSVVTTIGWGNIAPKTNAGRIGTIVYAVFGIPILFGFTVMLSNISNTGCQMIWKAVESMCYGRSRASKMGDNKVPDGGENKLVDDSNVNKSSSRIGNRFIPLFLENDGKERQDIFVTQQQMSVSSTCHFLADITSSYETSNFCRSKTATHCRALNNITTASKSTASIAKHCNVTQSTTMFSAAAQPSLTCLTITHSDVSHSSPTRPAIKHHVVTHSTRIKSTIINCAETYSDVADSAITQGPLTVTHHNESPLLYHESQQSLGNPRSRNQSLVLLPRATDVTFSKYSIEQLPFTNLNDDQTPNMRFLVAYSTHSHTTLYPETILSITTHGQTIFSLTTHPLNTLALTTYPETTYLITSNQFSTNGSQSTEHIKLCLSNAHLKLLYQPFTHSGLNLQQSVLPWTQHTPFTKTLTTNSKPTHSKITQSKSKQSQTTSVISQQNKNNQLTKFLHLSTVLTPTSHTSKTDMKFQDVKRDIIAQEIYGTSCKHHSTDVGLKRESLVFEINRQRNVHNSTQLTTKDDTDVIVSGFSDGLHQHHWTADVKINASKDTMHPTSLGSNKQPADDFELNKSKETTDSTDDNHHHTIETKLDASGFVQANKANFVRQSYGKKGTLLNDGSLQITKCFHNVNQNADKTEDADDDDDDEDEDSNLFEEDREEDEAAAVDENVPFIVYSTLFFCYLLYGGYIFEDLDTNKTLINGVYFTFVMLTTIGFGDIVPLPEYYHAMLIYGALGLSLTNLITNMIIDKIVDIVETVNSYWERKVTRDGVPQHYGYGEYEDGEFEQEKDAVV